MEAARGVQRYVSGKMKAHHEAGRYNAIMILLPENLRGGHVAHRANYALQPRARPMGQGLDLVAVRQWVPSSG